ncbi:MAG: hypothetical protein ACKO4O_02890 [Candidatus Limnocylindrus sp.]
MASSPSCRPAPRASRISRLPLLEDDMLTGLLLAAAVASALSSVEMPTSAPRRLAWRIRGALADGRPLEVHLDAAQLALLGWDWAR